MLSPTFYEICIQRFEQIVAIVETDVRKLRHDPYELLTRMIQPAIWLLIFGQAMAKRTRYLPVRCRISTT